MPTRFAAGDRVHIPRLGSGVIRDVRNGRYVVEIKGRTMVVDAAQVERARSAPSSTRSDEVTGGGADEPFAAAAASLDLHGKSVDEAMAALDVLINDALLASLEHVRVIHGRSGGRIRRAVHARLRQLPPVRSFRLDPRNPGVTIVSL